MCLMSSLKAIHFVGAKLGSIFCFKHVKNNKLIMIKCQKSELEILKLSFINHL